MDVEKINALAKQQELLGQEIIRLHSNNKKDSVSRKTPSYISKRLSDLEKLWETAVHNNDKLISTKMLQHTYFTTNYFQQMKMIHEEAVNYLNTCPKSTDESHPEEKSNTEEIQLATTTNKNQLKRLKQQEWRINSMHKTLIQINQEVMENKDSQRYEFLQRKITRDWELIQTLHEEIMDNEDGYQDAYFTENTFGDIEDKYENTTETLGHKIQAVQRQARPNIALPKITLPTFSGGYEEWPTFHDVFLKVIHNNTSLTDIEKMQYLKTHIRGDASTIIQHLQITEGNYATAWNILKRRYQNDRLLISKLIDKILDMPSVQKESSHELRKLYDITNECLEAINNLHIDTESWGPLIIRIITRKWDNETNKLYEQTLEKPHEVQSLQDLMKFLERRFQSLETIKTDNKQTNEYQRMSSRTQCPCCNRDHALTQCVKFKTLSNSERCQLTYTKRICYNCLNHSSEQKCYSPNRCHICNQPHHTLLHREQRTYNSNRTTTFRPTHLAKTNQRGSSAQISKAINHVGNQRNNITLLATALIQARSVFGGQEYLRVLIDPGSQAALITEEAGQRLRLPKQKIKAEITGLGGEPKSALWKISTSIQPRFPTTYSLIVEFLVLPKLTSTMPSSRIENAGQSIKEWQNYILADPTFDIPGPIDAIMGAQEFGEIIKQGIRKSQNGLLGQQTELGWILSGNLHHTSQEPIQVFSIINRAEEDNQLTRFWEIEEASTHRHLSQDDQLCEDHFKQTTKRNGDGTYTVRIPFKPEPKPLGNSRNRAIARLVQLEKRLSMDPQMRNEYNTFIQEYINLNHMRKVTNKDEETKYYIPHQPVFKDDNGTKKLRVVFDASCKTSTNVSLNETMLVGPRLQQDLADILLRWRKHYIVFTADIEKMYRQIKMSKEDQKYHRILWRFDTSQPIQEYTLTTVTYGTSPAQYLAIKTLHQLAADNREQFSKAAHILENDFYVDDLLSGAESINEARDIQNQLITLLKSGGFNLRKWCSNSKKLLQTIPEENKDQSAIEITEDGTRKSLGIHWAPFDDTFRFKVNTTTNIKNTKRNILSEIAKIFDPLGWLAPVTINAKRLIQELWMQDLDWDQPIPSDLGKKWTEFASGLKSVEDIKIPRWICSNETSASLELHGFCDASERAYGAVVYAVTVDVQKKTKITLLVAKSKVAPARSRVTLPRLELCAAVLLAKLLKRTTTALGISKVTIYAWTDSMIVLDWLKGETSKWKTFVANRVADTNKLLPIESWRHVRSEDNPADAISRGVPPSKIKNHTIWWAGPAWITNKEQWPIQPRTQATQLDLKVSSHVIQHNDEELIRRFSSLNRLIRVLSYCKRFATNSRKETKQFGELTLQEMETTLSAVIQTAQNIFFNAEIRSIQKHNQVHKNSKLVSLFPFLDKNNILRVGGRLEHSLMSYNKKHPIILPHTSYLTLLIIRDAHHNTLHSTNQATRAYIQRKYWITNGKKAVSSYINKCVKCLRYNARITHQLMGNLPAPRATPSPPFLHTGVDYTGPVQIRALKGRGHKSYKGYIAVFVCLSTKAIHLELVSSLTTDAFMAAYKRFTARRGHCAHLYSDNGTNFVGASKILEREIYQLTKETTVQNSIAMKGTQWHFIPPATPHFGGLWEAGVKSMKHHLKRIIGNSTLTYEELTTLLHQIEACLNSRPLCPLDEIWENREVEVLTPGHFLVGREIVSPPNPITTPITNNLSSRWRLLQKMKGDFWQSWSSEYLRRLQQRYKWQTNQDNLKQGEIVLVKEDINPSQWPLARITEVHPGADNKVRVVTIKKADGNSFKRSIAKLIPLPTNVDVPVTPKEELRVNTNTIQVKSKKNLCIGHAIIYLLLFLTCMPYNSRAEHEIRYPQPGLYIEHIGWANIERGTFRTQVKFEKGRLYTDATKVFAVNKQFQDFCEETKSLSDGTQCKALAHHLQEQEDEFKWIQTDIQLVGQKRHKRGLLGDLLTSIFGVNDEVYANINSLEQNQQKLIKSSNQQAKLMLSALASFNSTEIKINNKLEHFRERLNEGIDAINEMKKWFKTVDENKISIHMLNIYQVASNFISEVNKYYKRLLRIHHGKGSLIDILSPTQISSIIEQANSKLTHNLRIFNSPIMQATMEQDEDCFHVYGLFLIIDISDYDIIQATPIPVKIENGSFWSLSIAKELIAIDYNSQLYFTMSDNEFKNCITVSKNKFICSPAVIKNIETSPNCIIDEIYQRSDPVKCSVQKGKINDGIVWKQLYMLNTWLFITSAPTKIALICNGDIQDIPINQTGIIKITQDCYIQTKQNILAAHQKNSIPVIASYSKAMYMPINNTLERYSPTQLSHEPVFKLSDEVNNIQQAEEKIQLDLQESTWASLRHHSVATSSITTGILLTIAAIIGGLHLYRSKRRLRQTQTRSDGTAASTTDAIELQPLNIKSYSDLENGQNV